MICPLTSLPPDLSVVTWLLTTDHVHPDLSVTWSTCHPASGPRGCLLLTSSTTDDRPDQEAIKLFIPLKWFGVSLLPVGLKSDGAVKGSPG